MARHFEKTDKKKLIWMTAVAVVLVAAIIVAAVAFTGERKGKIHSAQDFFDTVHTYQDMDVQEGAKFVTGVQKCLDVKGKTIAYAVTAYGEGFAGRVSARCFFDLNKKTLIGIQIMEQYETAGSGANIESSMFTQRFEFKKMPVWFNDGTATEEELSKMKGTRIDTISGATISGRAVVDAVNAAYTYYVDVM